MVLSQLALPWRQRWIHFCSPLCSLPRNLMLWDWVWHWALLLALCPGEGAQTLEVGLSLGSRFACVWAAQVSEKWDVNTYFTVLWMCFVNCCRLKPKSPLFCNTKQNKPCLKSKLAFKWLRRVFCWIQMQIRQKQDENCSWVFLLRSC